MGNYVSVWWRVRGLRNGNYGGVRGVDIVVDWQMVLMVWFRRWKGWIVENRGTSLGCR